MPLGSYLGPLQLYGSLLLLLLPGLAEPRALSLALPGALSRPLAGAGALALELALHISLLFQRDIRVRWSASVGIS